MPTVTSGDPLRLVPRDTLRHLPTAIGCLAAPLGVAAAAYGSLLLGGGAFALAMGAAIARGKMEGDGREAVLDHGPTSPDVAKVWTRDGAVLLGRSDGREVWASSERMSGGMLVTGDAERRRRLLQAVAVQYVALGGGLAWVDGPNAPRFADAAGSMADAAGRRGDLVQVDLIDDGHDALSPDPHLSSPQVVAAAVMASAVRPLDPDVATQVGLLLRCVLEGMHALRVDGRTWEHEGLVAQAGWEAVTAMASGRTSGWDDPTRGTDAVALHGLRYQASLPSKDKASGDAAARARHAVVLGHLLAAFPYLTGKCGFGPRPKVAPYGELAAARRIVGCRVPSGEDAGKRFLLSMIVRSAADVRAFGRPFMVVVPDAEAVGLDLTRSLVGADGLAPVIGCGPVGIVRETSPVAAAALLSCRTRVVLSGAWHPHVADVVGMGAEHLRLARAVTDGGDLLVAERDGGRVVRAIVPELVGRHDLPHVTMANRSGRVWLPRPAAPPPAPREGKGAPADAAKAPSDAAGRGPANAATPRAARPAKRVAATLGGGPGLVVVPDWYVAPKSEDGRGTHQSAQRSYQDLAGERVPLVVPPAPSSVRAAVTRSSPHAASVLERVVSEVSTHGHVRFRPLLVHGPAGAGKTRFARALGRALGVPTTVHPSGGASDSSLGGTSRQWSTGRPSLPLQLVRDMRVANPLVILDELDKVADGRHNGNLADVLHGLLERETAEAYQDPFLEVACDLSAVLWVATANDLDRIPSTLRDRFRVVAMPEPTVDDAASLIASIAAEIAEDRGLDPVWAVDWSGNEVDAMAEAWGGGSLRRLRSLVTKATDALERGGAKVHH